VELPVIEFALENALDRKTPNFTTPKYVRRRENPWGNATVVDGVNSYAGLLAA
jgi:hypothetical protein